MGPFRHVPTGSPFLFPPATDPGRFLCMNKWGTQQRPLGGTKKRNEPRRRERERGTSQGLVPGTAKMPRVEHTEDGGNSCPPKQQQLFHEESHLASPVHTAVFKLLQGFALWPHQKFATSLQKSLQSYYLRLNWTSSRPLRRLRQLWSITPRETFIALDTLYDHGEDPKIWNKTIFHNY